MAFFTGAVRIPDAWNAPLMEPEELRLRWPAGLVGSDLAESEVSDAQELWEVQTYERLAVQFGRTHPPGSRLLPLHEAARELCSAHAAEVEHAGVPRSLNGELKLLTRLPERSRGILEYHQLHWLSSNYFPIPEQQRPHATSTVLAFSSPLPDSPP